MKDLTEYFNTKDQSKYEFDPTNRVNLAELDPHSRYYYKKKYKPAKHKPATLDKTKTF